MRSWAVNPFEAGLAGSAAEAGSVDAQGMGAAGGAFTSRLGQRLRIREVFLIARAAMPSPKPIMRKALTKLGREKHS